MGSMHTHPSPIYYLSQELIDQIIDIICTEEEVSTEDLNNDMASCSLVCQSFLPRVQKHLFAHIKFAMDDHTRIKVFAGIIDYHPAIASYIHKLSVNIREGIESKETRFPQWIYSFNPEFGWIMDRIIAAQRPSGLKALELEGYHRGYDLQNPSELMTRFIRPHIAPFITSLRLKSLWKLPPQLVSSCLNLKELNISYSTFLNPDDTQNESPLPKIQRLQHDGYQSELERLCTVLHLDLSGLRHFSVQTTKLHGLEVVQRIIDQSDGNLEELLLQIEDDEERSVSSPFLDFSKQPHIRSLDYVAFFDGPQSNSLAGICNTLGTIRALSNLTKLGLRVDIGGHSDLTLDSMQDLILTADWEALGRQIIRVAAAGELFSFGLIFFYYSQFDAFADEDDADSWRKLEEDTEVATRRLEAQIEQQLGIRDSISYRFNADVHLE